MNSARPLTGSPPWAPPAQARGKPSMPASAAATLACRICILALRVGGGRRGRGAVRRDGRDRIGLEDGGDRGALPLERPVELARERLLAVADAERHANANRRPGRSMALLDLPDLLALGGVPGGEPAL